MHRYLPIAMAALSFAAFASAQTVAEIAAPTVSTSLIDMDAVGPAGPTTLAAINAAGAPTAANILNLTLTPSTAAAGVYNTNPTEGRALGLDPLGSGNLELMDPPTGAFAAFNAQIDLAPSTEFGICIADWVGPIIMDFYLGGTLQTSFTSSTYTTAAIKYYQMTGGSFDRIDIRASTTAGNWVIPCLEIQNTVGLFPAFTATPTTGSSPLTVQFTDASFSSDPLGILAWAWDFENDGVIDSTVQNPSHIYPTCGDFTVALTVIDASPNAPATLTRTNFIRTDLMTPGFTLALVAPPAVYQFTDTTTPVPTAWAWDFDNDGVTDSTAQNPVWSYPAGCSTQTITLTTTLSCRTASTSQTLFIAPHNITSQLTGNNGTTSATWVGNMFDIQVTAPDGVKICGLTITPYTFVGPVNVDLYVTPGSYATPATRPNTPGDWRLVGSGVGQSLGGVFNAPTPIDVPLTQQAYLPAGNYGVAVFINNPAGTASISYTNGPIAGPISNGDLTLWPAGGGVGVSRTALFGGATFSPRLWNGTIHYSKCSSAGDPGYGFFGAGCASSNGAITSLTAAAGSAPRLGQTFTANLAGMPVIPSVAILIVGFSNTVSVFGPLPLDLSIVGAPGCFGRVSTGVNFVLVGANGNASWNLTIPNNPSLQCLQFYNQALVLDPGFNALGAVMSDAAGGILGL